MGTHRNISDDELRTYVGLPRPVAVKPDETVTVPDEFDDNYALPAFWQRVESAPAPTRWEQEPEEEPDSSTTSTED